MPTCERGHLADLVVTKLGSLQFLQTVDGFRDPGQLVVRQINLSQVDQLVKLGRYVADSALKLELITRDHL